MASVVALLPAAASAAAPAETRSADTTLVVVDARSHKVAAKGGEMDKAVRGGTWVSRHWCC
jgi:hypothetical protein